MSKSDGRKCNLTNKLEIYFCLLIFKFFFKSNIQKCYFSINFGHVLPFDDNKFSTFTFILKSFGFKRKRVENEGKGKISSIFRVFTQIF